MAESIFRGKVCIVTGGASGIGKELGRQLAAAGADVVLADIDAAKVNDAVAGIIRAGGKARAVRCDVTNAESMRSLIEGTAAQSGRIDYLFNNAGIGIAGEIRDLSLDHWRRVLDVNLFGVIHGIHYAYPLMIRQGFGHIVNTSSGYGMVPGPLLTPYVASKFGVYGISHALAAEAKGFGIAVSVICPGFVKTPILDEMQPVNAERADVLRGIPVAMVPVEKAAATILKGVAKKKTLIVFPGYVRLLAFLHRALPGLFMRLVQKDVRRFRRIRKSPA